MRSSLLHIRALIVELCGSYPLEDGSTISMLAIMVERDVQGFPVFATLPEWFTSDRMLADSDMLRLLQSCKRIRASYQLYQEDVHLTGFRADFRLFEYFGHTFCSRWLWDVDKIPDPHCLKKHWKDMFSSMCRCSLWQNSRLLELETEDKLYTLRNDFVRFSFKVF